MDDETTRAVRFGLLVGVAVGYLFGGHVVFGSATRRARRLGDY